MNKKAIITAVIVTLVLVVPIALIFITANSARPHEANAELNALNEALDYSRYRYDLPSECNADDFLNVSRTGKTEDKRYAGFAAGWRLLTDTEDLDALEAGIAEIQAQWLSAQERNGIGIANHPIVRQAGSTTAASYDDDFFAAHDLLLVDLCAEGAIKMYFYPENLTVEDGTISLDVCWDRDNAWTGSSAGQYCLITVPKGCTAAEINLLHDRG